MNTRSGFNSLSESDWRSTARIVTLAPMCSSCVVDFKQAVPKREDPKRKP